MFVQKRCYYCGKALTRKNHSIDHLRPLSKGGTDAKRNKVDACKICNTEKGCLLAEEFRVVLAYRAGQYRTKYKFFGEVYGKHFSD